MIENSLRRKDEKRKEKRKALKKRKEEELAKKRLEVKKLKKQKKQELLDKIKSLKELTGNEELGFNVSIAIIFHFEYFTKYFSFMLILRFRKKNCKKISAQMSMTKEWDNCLMKNFTN